MPELDADVPEEVTPDKVPARVLIAGAMRLLAQAGSNLADDIEKDDFEDEDGRDDAILNMGVVTGAFGGLTLGFPDLADTEGDET